MRTFNTYTITDAHAGLTVEDYIKQVLQISGRSMQKLTRNKGIFLNGKTTYLKRKVSLNDSLRILVQTDASFGVEPEKGSVDILYEDEQILVVNKPPYQLVHPAGQTSHGTVANHLAYYFEQQGSLCKIRPLHRLDRNTSGCVMFAKDAQSQHLLEQQLQEGIMKRSYQALVQGSVIPPSATINIPIGPHPTMPNRRSAQEKGDPAITHYRTLENYNDYTLLELSLETGRTHQIRVHLAHLGFPIIGDTMYGVKSAFIKRQALHAGQISFLRLKDQEQITITAPLPRDFLQALQLCSK